jgi:hypothetical protein
VEKEGNICAPPSINPRAATVHHKDGNHINWKDCFY